MNTITMKRANELLPEAITEYERRARQWGTDFIDVYQRNNVTPYVHAVLNHVSEFMQVHGSIQPFNQHGLEKLNDIVAKNFFRSSCHRGDSALRQLLEKQNRLDMHCNGTKKVKVFDVHCSNCKSTKHNQLTCTLACKECGTSLYHQYLKTVDGKRVLMPETQWT